jgi:hypothetical protein
MESDCAACGNPASDLAIPLQELLECCTSAPDADALQLPGRTTGSIEWRQARQETGKGAGLNASLPKLLCVHRQIVLLNWLIACPTTQIARAFNDSLIVYVSPGEASVSTAAAGGKGPSSTPYFQQRNAQLDQGAFAAFGRLAGGAFRASGHNSPSEAVHMAFDGVRGLGEPRLVWTCRNPPRGSPRGSGSGGDAGAVD